MFVTFAGSDSLCLSTEVHVHTHILQNGKISYLYRDVLPLSILTLSYEIYHAWEI